MRQNLQISRSFHHNFTKNRRDDVNDDAHETVNRISIEKNSTVLIILFPILNSVVHQMFSHFDAHTHTHARTPFHHRFILCPKIAVKQSYRPLFSLFRSVYLPGSLFVVNRE